MLEDGADPALVTFGGETFENEMRISLKSVATTLLGSVAVSGEAQSVEYDSTDPAFSSPLDEGEKAESVVKAQSYHACLLCQPVLAPDSSVLGVIEVVNKRGGVFDTEDRLLLELYANVLGSTLWNISRTKN